MFRHWRIALAVLILLLTVPPPLASWWEAVMVRHMLGHYPLLVLAGALLAPRGWGEGKTGQPEAIAAILFTIFTVSFWMLPRWLDAAVNSYAIDLAKMGSLVFLAGIPLGWAWPRLVLLARAFVLAQFASMLGIVGTLYLISPVRLCNNYLVDDQTVLGYSAISVALGIVLIGLVSALIGRPLTSPRPPRA